MFGDPARDLPQGFAFLLMPEFSMMPVTAAIEPLRIANRLAEKQLYTWQMYSVDGEAVAASNGFTLACSGNLDCVDEHAIVIICGGINVQSHTRKPMINFLRKAARRGSDIGSLCTASHVLAAAGCLMTILARSTGKTCRPFRRISRRSGLPEACLKSTAIGLPAPVAPRR